MLTVDEALAVTFMMVMYALERRSPWFVLAFAVEWSYRVSTASSRALGLALVRGSRTFIEMERSDGLLLRRSHVDVGRAFFESSWSFPLPASCGASQASLRCRCADGDDAVFNPPEE